MTYSEGYSLYEAEKLIYAFHELLENNCININFHSDLYWVGNKIIEFYKMHKNPKLRDTNIDVREEMQEALGFEDFISKIYSVRDHPKFKNLIPHIRLMNTASFSQIKTTTVLDQNSDKLFELYITSLCMMQFEDVHFAPPNDNKGKNPDIMFRYKNKRWAIACKVMHTDGIKVKSLGVLFPVA
ncbi:MAG: hypothetical protein HQK96_20935 [Nitrospirae bacterium]|nr:hypothetical protein [Nitrospirota bacterium]